ncbi:YfhO family protein [Flavobacterium silvaticum]|uniref:YfhO family protein n=1 Tax=Flavobacterium silvaticum TaxID=1852020 RepID=A0A972FKA7_9FLAO|nr:YfhO family protein [Flavobacterium silvaticum]NMH26785.1 YfhO family protein [Flavobacterium silvaticum]
MKQLQRFYPHLLVIIGFIFASLLYFYPVLQGKKIYQSDIAQYTGMAKEQNDFRAAGKGEPYWTNSSFGGMPTYQLGANYKHDYIGVLDDALRFLPRPADYLFLYFLGFYVLMLAMKADPLKAFLGALAFGFSTYLIVILGVGHNAKAHAIAYMPAVVAGVILVFRRKYIVGGLLTLIAAALEINANHFQMTYYLLFLLGAIVIYYLYEFIKAKEYKELAKVFGVFAIAGILAMGANASNLMATSEFADFSIRGKSELTFTPEGGKKGSAAMDYDYITEYSYGITESLDLIVPRMFGGSNGEKLGPDSHMYEFMVNQGVPENQARDAVDSMPLYWGDQPIVAAPAYIGAVVFFFGLIGLFVDKRNIKYAFLAGALLSLFLSWGKNFPALTDFFIHNVPLYDKFRAVSSIQVVLELCFPVLAIMGLQSYFQLEKEQRIKALYKPVGVFFGLIALLFLFKGSFDFAGGSDAMLLRNYGPDFVDALKADRKSFYSSDLLRSSFFVIISIAVLWLWSTEKLKQRSALILLGIFMIGDLFFIDKNYVSQKDFVDAREVDMPFQASEADNAILKDTTHYRVFETSQINQARTSYFHKSISGYSAVRPRRMEELLHYQIAKNNLEILNLLNVKYVIQQNEKGEEFVIPNTEANGNAWFVDQVQSVNSADAEMKALDKLKSKHIAIVNTTQFPQAASKQFSRDSVASAISLIKYEPNRVIYQTKNAADGFAVFSEMYYPKGWIATIDGKETPILRADYTLRALNVPAGNHKIEFRFEPEVIKTGGAITLASGFAIVLLAAGGLYYEFRRKQKK